MIATLLFVLFIAMMLAGVPIGVALGLAGAAAIGLANAGTQWFGLLAVPQNFYAGLGKYPLLAIPMFVLVGSIFDRSGVALRLVNFAVAIVGRGPGMLPLVAIVVAMFLGGISGSGPANAAAVGAVMIAAIAAGLLSEGWATVAIAVGVAAVCAAFALRDPEGKFLTADMVGAFVVGAKYAIAVGAAASAARIT